jgi:hypothetical protein
MGVAGSWKLCCHRSAASKDTSLTVPKLLINLNIPKKKSFVKCDIFLIYMFYFKDFYNKEFFTIKFFKIKHIN